MLKKIIVSILCIFIPLISASADTGSFAEIRGYDGNFDADISSDDWYYDYAVTLYRIGLAEGSEGRFMPLKTLSIAEAVTFAARLHSIYYTGSPDAAGSFAPGENWYDTYFSYAESKLIIDDRFRGMEEAPALRKYAAYIFSFVFPMDDINDISGGDIPDLDEEYSYYITKAYSCGIMNGTDASLAFAPDASLLRCEAAAIVSRCAVPDMRIGGIEKSSWAATMPEASYADGIIVVSSSSPGTGNLSFHKKSENGVWTELLSVPCYIGRNGLGKTSEGDGKTPCGTFRLGTAFGIEDDPGTALDYVKVDNSHYWVDDPSSDYYNTLVNSNDVVPDWSSAEHLASYSTAYAYAVDTGYNSERTPGIGSAIFIHCSTGSPTAGCIAVDRESMIFLLRSVTPDTVIVIG